MGYQVAFWPEGRSNEIEVQMYNTCPHLLPCTIPVRTGHEVILMRRAEFTLEKILAGSLTTKEIIPLMPNLCEYLRKLSAEAARLRLRVKDFSTNNVAFFYSQLPHDAAGGLSPLRAGGTFSQAWSCCDFGNWELLSPLSVRGIAHFRKDVLSRLESSEHWTRRSNLFACLSHWLNNCPDSHTAEQATWFLREHVVLPRVAV